MKNVNPTNHLTGCDVCQQSGNFFAKVCAAIMLFLCIMQFSAFSQGAQPACNISGPLVATAGGADIVINVQVGNSTSQPQLNYSFLSNLSGAVITSQGAISYDATNNTATQQITVSPGTTGSGFTINLQAVTPNGISQCSKSVSVTQ